MNKTWTWTTLTKSIGITLGLILSLQSFCHAGNFYVYRDTEGSVLLTNKKVNSGSYKQEKVTYYPDTNVHSYTNWGKSEAAILPSFSKSKNAYDSIIQRAAQTYNVSEGLIKAIMHTESGFNANARSPVGAQGLMQLMPATARRFNVNNAYNPTENIHGATKYLSWLLKRFNGNTQLALAAYNAGEGNVDKYGGIPPFKETQDYVRRVMSRYNNLYTNGLGMQSNNQQQDDIKVLSTSNNYTPSSTPSYPKREIVYSNGVYTDRPITRTYATDTAIVTSNISISNY